MRGIATFFAIALSAVAALPTADHDRTTGQESNSSLSRNITNLKVPDPGLYCFPSTGPGVTSDNYETSISNFVWTKMRTGFLPQNAAISYTYEINDDLNLFISVVNSFCDGNGLYRDPIDARLKYAEILRGCSGDTKCVGGTVQFDCGMYQLQPMAKDGSKMVRGEIEDVETSSSNTAVRDPTTSLAIRAEPICFPSSHLSVPLDEITSAINFFCAISDNHVLPRNQATSTDSRTISTNDKLYISVTNTWCDAPVTLTKDGCLSMFDKIVDSCQGPESKSAGGTVQDECGLWQVQPGV